MCGQIPQPGYYCNKKPEWWSTHSGFLNPVFSSLNVAAVKTTLETVELSRYSSSCTFSHAASCSAHLGITVAKRNGIIISYIVQLLDTHGAVVQNETVAVQDPTFDSPQSLAHNFTSLKPYTRYLWRVAATTTAGAGPFSANSLFHTLESSELLGVRHNTVLLLFFCNCSCSITYIVIAYPHVL